MKNLTWCSLVFSVLLLFLIPSISFAQITVTSTADSGPGSLRQAVIDSAPNGTIDFDLSGLGAPPHIITLTTGEIVIDKSLTINGSGKTDLIISGNSSSRIFRTDSAGFVLLRITDLTIQDGDVRGNAGPGGQEGGGIHHTAIGFVFLVDCVMSNNISGGDEDGGGGAVFTTSNFRADRCEFLNNQSINLTDDSFGGVIDFRSRAGTTVTIADSRLEGNSSVSLATARGGAIYARSDSVSAPTINILRTQFINNTAQGNIAQGGAAYTFETNLFFTDSIIIDNTADGVEEGSGGAIHSERGFIGVMTVLFTHNYSNVTISRNTARGHLATGGAIHKSDHVSIFLNATISENVVESIEGSGTPRALGAAIYSVDGGSETIEASTIVFNQVTGPAGSEFVGAGILQHGNSTETRLNNTIIAGNFYGRTEGVTIIGGSDGTSFASSNCGEFEGFGVPDFQLVNVNITDNGIPLGSPGGDACSVLFNPDFIATEMLGPLQDNGGSTLTHALIDTMDPLPANPAIDGVPDGQCNRFDQVVGRRFDDFLKPDESIFYRVNNSEAYPFNSLLSFEPLFLDHIGDGLFKAIDYEGDIITHDDNEYYDILEEYQKDAGSGVNSPEMFEDLRGPALGPPITTDGRPFPRPVDWNDLGIALCDIGAFELQAVGNIIITKVSNPSGVMGFEFLGGDTFLLEYGCDLRGMFTLDDGESTAGCILPVGTYTVTETNSDPDDIGQFFDEVTCVGSAMTTAVPFDPSITVDIINDEDTAFCTFLNGDGFGSFIALSVVLQGAGTGSAVTGTPGEIDCTSNGNMDCGESYSPGETVTLTATPDPGSEFVGWSGDCPATTMNDTTITLNVSSVCIATFALLPVTLTVELQGSGTGNVLSNNTPPLEIDCTSVGNMDCDEVYTVGETVTLNATPDVGSTFTGWAGDAACTGDPTNPLLMLTMDMDINCIAVFDLIPVTLNVEIQGAGQGGVTASDTLIDCNSTGTMDCDEIYGFGDTVTLTAAPQSGSFFTGWSGDAACIGDPTNPVLDLTMNMDISCIATFELLVTLNVEIQGAGQGGVASTPTGQIDCSNTGQTDCDETYVPGNMVTLTAAPQSGSFFTGWSGDSACTGDPTNPVLDLTMNMDISCIATFELLVTLDVTIQGAGQGGVTSTPTGQIDCSNTGQTDCDEDYVPGSMVTLTAAPQSGSFFTGWSGDGACTGDPTSPVLDLTMNMDISCIASFDVIPPTAVTLDVILQGPGSCTVTSSPNVINCEGDCTETFNPPGVTVDLTVTPDPGSIFVDWTGDCNDLNPDTSITVNEDSVCIATCILSDFVLNPIFPAIDDNVNSISAEEATPGGNVAFTWAQRSGSFRVGGRVCNGIELGLRNPRILAIKRANDLGVATHIFYIPTFGDLEFQLELQAVDIETCRTSNIVPQIVRKDEGG